MGVNAMETVGSFVAEVIAVIAAEGATTVGKIEEAVVAPIPVRKRAIEPVIIAVVRVIVVGSVSSERDIIAMIRAARGEHDYRCHTNE
jgi:hypothetical protein